MDALALNAGRGAGGAFVGGTDLADELEIVDLNVRSTVHLAKLLLPGMVERGARPGALHLVDRLHHARAFQAVYNASKSFVQSFAEALRNELKDTGVTVTSLMPGPTDTEFFDRADMEDTRVGSGRKDDPAKVAAQGFEALMRGDQTVAAGSLMNKVQARRRQDHSGQLKSEQHRRMAEPGSGSSTRGRDEGPGTGRSLGGAGASGRHRIERLLDRLRRGGGTRRVRAQLDHLLADLLQLLAAQARRGPWGTTPALPRRCGG